MTSNRWIALCLASLLPFNQAFVPVGATGYRSSSLPTFMAASVGDEANFLLSEFTMHTGEIVEPYKVLKVSEQADRLAIKQAYRDLSRRYHPDAVRHRDILPGSCNNLNEVRDHWERIKFSYEILSDKKRRSRYDRHYALSDPGEALKRAAVKAAVSGIADVGKGIFNVGAFAFQQMAGKSSNESKTTV